jgi:hypothetical protein
MLSCMDVTWGVLLALSLLSYVRMATCRDNLQTDCFGLFMTQLEMASTLSSVKTDGLPSQHICNWSNFPKLVNQLPHSVTTWYVRFRIHFCKFLFDHFCIFISTMNICSTKKTQASSDNTIITTLECIQAAHWGEYGSMLQKSCTPHKVYVWDILNHFPLPTQHRFTILPAGAQGRFAHPGEQILERQSGKVWTEFIWFRIGTHGRLLGTQ